MNQRRQIFLICILFVQIIPKIIAQDSHARIINPQTSEQRDTTTRSWNFDFYHEMMEKTFSIIDPRNVKKHQLGIDVAIKMHAFEQMYSYISDAAPGAMSGKRIINKPGIYNSIIKIDKYFRRQAKKGIIAADEAGAELCHYLDIAWLLYHQDTKDFEKELKDTKKTTQIIDLYSRIKM